MSVPNKKPYVLPNYAKSYALFDGASIPRTKQLNIFKYKQAEYRLNEILQRIDSIDELLHWNIKQFVTEYYYQWRLDAFAQLPTTDVHMQAHKAETVAHDMESSIAFLESFISTAPPNLNNQNPQDKRMFQKLVSSMKNKHERYIQEKDSLLKSLEETKLEKEQAFHDFVIQHGKHPPK